MQEEKHFVKKILIDYQKLHPSNFEKQKVQLVFKIFNVKRLLLSESTMIGMLLYALYFLSLISFVFLFALF